MTRIFQIAARTPVWIASAALFVLMAMTFCDVVMRSSLNAPIEAASELTRILVAVMVFAVMPHVSATGKHIAVDLSDPWFARLRLSRARDGLIHLLCGAMLVWPVIRVWGLAERTRGYGDVTQYVGIPQHWTMWFIALGATLASAAMLATGLLILFAPRHLPGENA